MTDQLDRELDEMLEKLQKISADPPTKGKSRITIHQPEGQEKTETGGGYIPPAGDFPETGGPAADIYGEVGGAGFENHVPGGTRIERPGTRSSRAAFRFFGNSWDGERILTVVLTVITVIAVILIIINFEAVSMAIAAGFAGIAAGGLKTVIVVGLIVLVIRAMFGGWGGRGRRYF